MLPIKRQNDGGNGGLDGVDADWVNRTSAPSIAEPLKGRCLSPRGAEASRRSDQMKQFHRDARLVLMLALAAFMFFGPFYRQVLMGQNPFFPRWVMYSGAGLGVVRVEFFLEDHAGQRRRLERVGAGGKELHLISGMADLHAMIRELVSQHHDSRALIVNAEIATPLGWETVYREEPFDLRQR